MERFAEPYFRGLGLEPCAMGALPAGLDEKTKEVVVLTHPLWERKVEARLGAVLAEAKLEAEWQGYRPIFHSLLRAVRFPYHYPDGE